MKRALLGVLVASAALVGCRYEVRFDDRLDGSVDGDAIAPDVEPDVSLDADLDGGPDAPVRPCTLGIELLDSVSTSSTSAPTIASSRSGASRRHGLLVPPAAHPGSITSDLFFLDGDGAILGMRSLTIDDGAAGPAQTATIHARRDAPGFLVLAPTRILLLDEGGGLERSVTLTTPPSPARQRDAGWIDDTQFVFVNGGPTEPLAVLDVLAGSVLETTASTLGAARVFVSPGAVAISAAPPSADVTQYDADAFFSAPTLRITWPGGPLGSRLLGGAGPPMRRFLVADGSEFRATVNLYAVDAAGATPLGSSMTLLGPLTGSQEDELITLIGGDGTLTAYDLSTSTFIPLGTVTDPTFTLVERSSDGFVTVARETRPTGVKLVLRCVPE